MADILHNARDAAILLLALEAFALFIIPLLLFYHLNRWLRRFIPRLVSGLQRVQEVALRISRAVEKGMRIFSAPFLWLAEMAEGMRALWWRARQVMVRGR
ncbi:MAG: hypothetical protein J7M05_03055 [Anaerolineae bacterium]|nr:hypothetical protein [Anaerolineae bacterium]